MNGKAINGSIKKIALISIFLIFLVGTASALPDLYVSSASTNYKYAGEIYANENNSMVVTVCNAGDQTASDAVVSLSVTDAASNPVVVNYPIGDIAASACATVTLIDPTIRTSQGSTVTYTVQVNCTNAESNYDNNTLTTSGYEVLFNGYKGKRYWTGASDITTKHTYEGNINMTYYNQTEAKYASTSWGTRSEVWTPANLVVPDGSTVLGAWLYVSYNWDNTSTGMAGFGMKFNDNASVIPLNNYTDQSNIGSYGDKKYGLISLNVTDYYDANGYNYLNMTQSTSGYVQALYPSSLVVVYANANESQRQIFINEECDELAITEFPNYNYNVTSEEATEYVPFEEYIDKYSAVSATLYSFVASAGHPTGGPDGEGNMFFNDYTVGTYLWEGTSYSAFPYIADVKGYLSDAGDDNVASIQATSRTGMLNIEQVLVVEY
ncbi:cell surface protein [Methanolacinia petrolearia DSM 11571]|uniref:Cell surface protein n=2 Tax=Methanolacinia TaxID=230355 RepID=E1RDC3_METP4|nr:cell surface protein [Methanolacinia petrolearia DSM 11571]